MSRKTQIQKPEQNKAIRIKNGRLYFTKETERLIYFALTVVMLLAGLMVKIGLF